MAVAGNPYAALRAAALAAALAAAPAAGLQAGHHDPHRFGPAAGAPIPHDLAARDQHGQERDFKSLARRRGLVILFAKSLDW